MNAKLQNLAQLFARNVDALRGDFVWHEAAAKRLAALVYTLDGKEIDIEAIRNSHNLMKNNVGVFSTFRGNMAIFIASALSLAENPAKLLENTLQVYDMLKQEGFWSNDYLVVTAFEIAANSTDYAGTVQRAMEFYKEMKANHRWHIGQPDYIFAAMMALSELEPHAGAVKMKLIFQQIRSEFSRWMGKNSQLTLAQMMTLGGSTEYCAANLAHLNRTLRQRKIRLDKTYTLPSLGVLGLLDTPHHTMADEIIATEQFLRAQKGLGHWSVTQQELLLYVVSLIASSHATETDSMVKAGIATSVTNLIIAQQVALIVTMSVVTTAAASSS